MCKIGFIGCGNMGSAIARAVAGCADPACIMLSNRTRQKAEDLAGELGCSVGSNEDVASECGYIFLGVKPGMMEEVLTPLREILRGREKFVLITMAAGVKIADIKSMAGGEYPVIRIMPNTPVSIGKGMILTCTSPEVGDECLAEFEHFMSGCGCLDYIKEELIDAGSAVSGCGPAYVYMFIEAMADGGVECGLPRDKAVEYACNTLIGAASMVLESGEHPGKLKDAVCSPGGSTIAGVHALEKGGLRNSVMDGVKAAYDKTVQMGK